MLLDALGLDLKFCVDIAGENLRVQMRDDSCHSVISSRMQFVLHLAEGFSLWFAHHGHLIHQRKPLHPLIRLILPKYLQQLFPTLYRAPQFATTSLTAYFRGGQGGCALEQEFRPIFQFFFL